MDRTASDVPQSGTSGGRGCGRGRGRGRGGGSRRGRGGGNVTPAIGTSGSLPVPSTTPAGCSADHTSRAREDASQEAEMNRSGDQERDRKNRERNVDEIEPPEEE